MFFKKRRQTTEEAYDEYINELKTVTGALPTESLISASMFAAVDKARDMGLSEDERTDIHVAGICAYRDICMVAMFDLIRKRPDQIPHFHKNSSMNAVANYNKFVKLTRRIGFNMEEMELPKVD